MLKNKILATTLSVSLLAPLANPLLENAKAANDTEDIGKGSDIEIIKRTEDKTSNKWGVTQNIQFDFVKDKKYNKDALILKMQGFISSRTTYYNYKKTNHVKAMRWPFQYNIGLKTNDKYVSLINYLPKNKIESTNVSQTLGYNIGGNFQSAPSLGGNGSFNYSKSISYTQQNYVSEVEQQNSKSVLWGVKANSFATESGQKSAFDSDLFVATNLIVKILEIISFQTVSYLLLYKVDLTLHLSPQYLMKKVQAIQANLKLLTEETWMSLMPLKDQRIMATVI